MTTLKRHVKAVLGCPVESVSLILTWPWRLRDPEITDYWVQELRQSNFCDVNYSSAVNKVQIFLMDPSRVNHL